MPKPGGRGFVAGDGDWTCEKCVLFSIIKVL